MHRYKEKIQQERDKEINSENNANLARCQVLTVLIQGHLKIDGLESSRKKFQLP